MNDFWENIAKLIDAKIAEPSSAPSAYPSSFPTSSHPSNAPSSQPSVQPSSQPSIKPSSEPSFKPSSQSSSLPSMRPSSEPSYKPSSQPSSSPTFNPSYEPSYEPSLQPSSSPSKSPSNPPSNPPSSVPSVHPSIVPSLYPSIVPTTFPSQLPTKLPSSKPTLLPSLQPSQYPTIRPSSQPSIRHSLQPSEESSLMPSRTPPTVQTQRFDINLTLIVDHTGSFLSQEDDPIFRSTTLDFASRCISNFNPNLGIQDLSLEISSQEVNRNGLEIGFILSGAANARNSYMIRVAVTKCFEIQHQELDQQLQASLSINENKNTTKRRDNSSEALLIGAGILSIALISIIFGMIYSRRRAQVSKLRRETSYHENGFPDFWRRSMAERSSSRDLPEFNIDAFLEDDSIQNYIDGLAYECSEVSSVTYY